MKNCNAKINDNIFSNVNYSRLAKNPSYFDNTIKIFAEWEPSQLQKPEEVSQRGLHNWYLSLNSSYQSHCLLSLLTYENILTYDT